MIQNAGCPWSYVNCQILLTSAWIWGFDSGDHEEWCLPTYNFTYVSGEHADQFKL
jgi:hypothetical protein